MTGGPISGADLSELHPAVRAGHQLVYQRDGRSHLALPLIWRDRKSFAEAPRPGLQPRGELRTGEQRRVGERLQGEAGGDVVMPALKVRDFNFTSLSEAV